jgi:hypothetical protein
MESHPAQPLLLGILVRERPLAGIDFCAASRGQAPKILLQHNRRTASDSSAAMTALPRKADIRLATVVTLSRH